MIISSCRSIYFEMLCWHEAATQMTLKPLHTLSLELTYPINIYIKLSSPRDDTHYTDM